MTEYIPTKSHTEKMHQIELVCHIPQEQSRQQCVYAPITIQLVYVYVYLISLKSGKVRCRRGLSSGKLCTRMCWQEVRFSRQGRSVCGVIRGKGIYW